MRVGIDIGGSHIASGLVGKNGKLIDKENRDIDVGKMPDEESGKKLILDVVTSEIDNLLAKNDFTASDISKIGIAAPGNPKGTKIRNLVNLHIDEFDLGSKLEEIYQAKVKIKNDAKCAGLAEIKYGALKGYDDAIFLCIGTGVGSAVFLQGELLEPKQNAGFELGHMVIEKDGIQCNCGKKGCFETYTSMKRFKANVIKEFGLDKDIESEEVQQYVRRNINMVDVHNFVENYLDNLCIGLENFITIFEPEAICFGGSFSFYTDIFLPIVEKKVEEHAFNKETKVKFVQAKLKNDAGIIGATEI